jgi:hypothetical protein
MIMEAAWRMLGKMKSGIAEYLRISSDLRPINVPALELIYQPQAPESLRKREGFFSPGISESPALCQEARITPKGGLNFTPQFISKGDMLPRQ